MAVGDPITDRTPVDYKVISGSISETEQSRFWERKVFPVRRPGRVRRFLGKFWSAFARPEGELAEVLDTNTDRFVLGGLAWEIPFRHIYLVSAPDGICDHTRHPEVEQEVIRYLSQKFDGFVDKDETFSVRCLTSSAMEPDAEENVEIYLGSTIFAPDRDETPVGYLRYYPDPSNPADWIEPRLVDGTPAGIYRGQRELGFAVSDNSKPANLGVAMSNPGKDARAMIRSSGRKSENAGFEASFLRPSNDQGSYLSAFPAEKPEDEFVDQSWSMAIVQPTPGASASWARLDLCLDERPSRLWHSPRHDGGEQFELSEIRVDLTVFGTDATGVWLNFDGNGQLIFSAMQKKRYSVFWDSFATKPILYDWLEESENWKRSPVDVKMLDTGEISFVHRDGPFGFLRPETEDRTASFGQRRPADRFYQLDWLDFAGAVKIDGEGEWLGHAYDRAIADPVIMPAKRPAQDSNIRIGPLVLS